MMTQLRLDLNGSLVQNQLKQPPTAQQTHLYNILAVLANGQTSGSIGTLQVKLLAVNRCC